MARKKYRDIIIDGENWAWMFRTADDCYGTQDLTIWRERKKVFEKGYFYNREKKKYQIRPSLIARFIKTYLKK